MARSLLDYLDAPVLVGDPDGRIVHLNPAFESRFDVSLQSVRGGLMASLFEGGPREAVLRAVAEVCGGAGSSRFKLREGDLGYTAVASPISSDENRIGVVILLREESASGRRISRCAKELQPPLDELTRCLGKLSGQLEIEPSVGPRAILEDASGLVEQLRKLVGELESLAARSTSGG